MQQMVKRIATITEEFMTSKNRWTLAHILLRPLVAAAAACVLVTAMPQKAAGAERFQMAVFHNFDPRLVDLEWIELPGPGALGNGQSGSGRNGVLLVNYFLV